jgi:FlaA1/EpsC-like NDP-sugar epimerase
MGKPVKIADLARRMIELSGLSVCSDSNPQGDIEISYTGLRPAEKLFEELIIGKNVTGTEHPRILRAVEHALPWSRIEELLEELLLALARLDCAATLAILQQAVAEYQPVERPFDLVDRARETRSRPDRVGEPATVTKIASHRIN